DQRSHHNLLHQGRLGGTLVRQPDQAGLGDLQADARGPRPVRDTENGTMSVSRVWRAGLFGAGLLGAGLVGSVCVDQLWAAPTDRFTPPFAETAKPVPDLPELQRRAEAGEAE